MHMPVMFLVVGRRIEIKAQLGRLEDSGLNSVTAAPDSSVVVLLTQNIKELGLTDLVGHFGTKMES